MTYLLDTCVVSELRKRPGVVDLGVLEWAQAHPARDLSISVVTIQEIELGVLLRERRDPEQGGLLRRWFEDGVLAGFAGRVVSVDIEVARAAARMHVPDPRPERDAVIAATASVHSLTVVTRNVADFDPTGVPVINPWRA